MPKSKYIFSEAQKEIRRLRARQWAINNPERFKANQLRYTLANAELLKEKAKLAAKKRLAVDPDYQRKAIARHYEGRPWLKYYDWAKARCNPNTKNKRHLKQYVEAGIKFFLTPSDVEHIWHRDGASSMKKPTLDRILSGGHYELANCRFLEHRDNCSRRFNPDTEALRITKAWKRHNDSVLRSPSASVRFVSVPVNR